MAAARAHQAETGPAAAQGATYLGGGLEYRPVAASAEQARAWFLALRDEIDWRQPRVRLFGREIGSPRLAAWYGDPGAVYTYSGLVNEPLPWTETLAAARRLVERACGQSFNGVLANLYRSGADSMGWHSDNESELDPHAAIASLSLGAARRFRLAHKRRRGWRAELVLAPGSLLVMRAPLQQEWRHAVPVERGLAGARINLTFRRVR